MTTYEKTRSRITLSARTWLVTGAAGFIGSHLVENLLALGQRVLGLDNFSTGKRENLDFVRRAAGEAAWSRFRFIEGDIRSLETCTAACASVDTVLHQAGLGSVPRSIERPLRTHDSNVNGFHNMLVAARDAGVGRFVYASSSAVYGDHAALPKVESQIGRAMSPYGLSKRINELYADVFAACYEFQSVGLRYFNVFGPRQDPDSPYAAVIPNFIRALLEPRRPLIFGDGEQSRDFTYVDNAVQANLLAMDAPLAGGRVYNVACGERVSVNRLLAERGAVLGSDLEPEHAPPRPADVRHTLADLTRARTELGYEPLVMLREGLERTVASVRRTGRHAGSTARR